MKEEQIKLDMTMSEAWNKFRIKMGNDIFSLEEIEKLAREEHLPFYSRIFKQLRENRNVILVKYDIGKNCRPIGRYKFTHTPIHYSIFEEVRKGAKLRENISLNKQNTKQTDRQYTDKIYAARWNDLRQEVGNKEFVLKELTTQAKSKNLPYSYHTPVKMAEENYLISVGNKKTEDESHLIELYRFSSKPIHHSIFENIRTEMSKNRKGKKKKYNIDNLKPWKPGESGNPKGRPRKSSEIKEDHEPVKKEVEPKNPDLSIESIHDYVYEAYTDFLGMANHVHKDINEDMMRRLISSSHIFINIILEIKEPQTKAGRFDFNLGESKAWDETKKSFEDFMINRHNVSVYIEEPLTKEEEENIKNRDSGTYFIKNSSTEELLKELRSRPGIEVIAKKTIEL